MLEPYTPHRFNPQVAELYGINAALIFRYICFCSRSGSTRWVDPTLEDICKQYPYLGEWQVWAALQTLIHPGRKTPPLLLRKQVRGVYLYAPVNNDNDEVGIHSFDVRIAKKVGVVAAVIFHNVGHWIRENWIRRADTLVDTLNPADFDYDLAQVRQYAYQMTRGAAAHYTTIEEWLERHPYVSRRTAERGFAALQKAGLLRKGIQKRRKQFWHLTRTALNLFEQEMLKHSYLENQPAKTQSRPPKPKVARQNPKSPAKTQTKSRLSDCTEDGSGAVVEAIIEEATLRVKKQLGDNFNAFQPPAALAVARVASAETALGVGLTPTALPEGIRTWDQPNLPWKKKQRGEPRKRSYRRIPKPDDPEYYEYIDSLTLEERLTFMASGS